MLPNQLTPASFAGYPPQARQLAIRQLALLQRLPLTLLPLLLRELIVYDWKFPAERSDLGRQFAYLESLSPDRFRSAMAAFTGLRLRPELDETDWVNRPAIFSEQLSAHLWATHQIDGFRRAAVDYVAQATASAPDPGLPTHRVGIAIIGQGVAHSDYRLFRKLAPHGVHFTKVQDGEGVAMLLDAARGRAQAHPVPYGHWYLDGGAARAGAGNLTQLSWAALSPLRARLQERMRRLYEAPAFDPEAFRTLLAQTRPEEIGFDTGGDGVLSRFALSLLTEGSGTQLFATTFVQWAAREALRRAQPLTMVVRFCPRQREQPMSDLLARHERPEELDCEGSLIDADMGSYYTWLNQQRLPGEDQSTFLAWFEDHGEAVVVAPGLARGTRSDAPAQLADLVRRIA